MIEDLVSLIAPFYNAEKYLDRFLKSILSQTYTNIQFILINDGSTDSSDEIVTNLSKTIEDTFYQFKYLKKENGGAASAVNDALKYVEGEYLCWADCDDELLPENIEQKYNFLKTNLDCGLVVCSAVAIDQNTNCELRKLVIPSKKRKDNMFQQIIDGIPVYPGVFMIRTDLLFEKIIDRNIYFNPEAGQNYQLLLPVSYDHKCGFIDEVLYKYYIRKDSHSHNTSLEQEYQRTYVREILLNNVLSFLPRHEKDAILYHVILLNDLRRLKMNISITVHCYPKNGIPNVFTDGLNVLKHCIDFSVGKYRCCNNK